MEIESASLKDRVNGSWAIECKTDDENDSWLTIDGVDFDRDGFIENAAPYRFSEARARLITLLGQDKVWAVEEQYRDLTAAVSDMDRDTRY